MKILLASAQPDEVRWARANGLADGVVTSPALLAEEGPDGDEHALLLELCRAAGTSVVASVRSVSARDIYRDGRELAKVSDQIVVQVPLVEDAIVALRRLAADGVRVNTALVFSAAQALLAAKAGAAAVTAAVDRLDAIGQGALIALREMRAVFDSGDVQCELIAAHPGTAARFAECAIARADGVIVTPEALRAMLLHPLTDRGVDQLLTELAHRPFRPRVET
jgi:transaldolase